MKTSTFPGIILPLVSLKGQLHDRLSHITTWNTRELLRACWRFHSHLFVTVETYSHLIEVQVDVEGFHFAPTLGALLGWIQSPTGWELQQVCANHFVSLWKRNLLTPSRSISGYNKLLPPGNASCHYTLWGDFPQEKCIISLRFRLATSFNIELPISFGVAGKFTFIIGPRSDHSLP